MFIVAILWNTDNRGPLLRPSSMKAFPENTIDIRSSIVWKTNLFVWTVSCARGIQFPCLMGYVFRWSPFGKKWCFIQPILSFRNACIQNNHSAEMVSKMCEKGFTNGVCVVSTIIISLSSVIVIVIVVIVISSVSWLKVKDADQTLCTYVM